MGSRKRAFISVILLFEIGDRLPELPGGCAQLGAVLARALAQRGGYYGHSFQPALEAVTLEIGTETACGSSSCHGINVAPAPVRPLRTSCDFAERVAAHGGGRPTTSLAGAPQVKLSSNQGVAARLMNDPVSPPGPRPRPKSQRTSSVAGDPGPGLGLLKGARPRSQPSAGSRSAQAMHSFSLREPPAAPRGRRERC